VWSNHLRAQEPRKGLRATILYTPVQLIATACRVGRGRLPTRSTVCMVRNKSLKAYMCSHFVDGCGPLQRRQRSNETLSRGDRDLTWATTDCRVPLRRPRSDESPVVVRHAHLNGGWQASRTLRPCLNEMTAWSPFCRRFNPFHLSMSYRPIYHMTNSDNISDFSTH